MSGAGVPTLIADSESSTGTGRGFGLGASRNQSQGLGSILRDAGRTFAICVATIGTSSTAGAAQDQESAILLPEGSTHTCPQRALTENPSQDVKAIRELSGLPWGQIAQIFGVDRRTIHLWLQGSGVNARNVQNLAKVAAYLRRLSGEHNGDPDKVRAFLRRPNRSGGDKLDHLLDEAGGRRADVPRKVLRQPSAASRAQSRASKKGEPTWLDRLNSSYDAVRGDDGELIPPRAVPRRPKQ